MNYKQHRKKERAYQKKTNLNTWEQIELLFELAHVGQSFLGQLQALRYDLPTC